MIYSTVNISEYLHTEEQMLNSRVHKEWSIEPNTQVLNRAGDSRVK